MTFRHALERSHSPTLDEKITTVTFPSGLRALLCHKPGFKKKYACYCTFYGSVDSEFVEPDGTRVKVPDGIAHFLEHTLFETEAGNASDIFARRGAYNNAATSFTTTTYIFAATDHFYENLELLVHFVENPVFHPDKVEKEKGIIEQEIQGYKDNPQWVSYMGLLENLFHEHPMRIDIAGTVESIRKIDSAALHKCYKAFYHPSNMLLFVVGDVSEDEFFSFVDARSRFAAFPPQPGGVKRIYPEEPTEVCRPAGRETMELALPKLLLGFKEVGVPHAGEEFVLHDLVSEFAMEILFGKSSDTYQELYDERLILDDFGASYGIGAGIGYGIIGGDTPEPERLRDILLERIRKLVEGGIRSEDFEREKRKFIGGFIRGFNSLEYIASHYTYFLFHGFDLFRSIDLLSKLDRDGLEARVASLLNPSHSSCFMLVPR